LGERILNQDIMKTKTTFLFLFSVFVLIFSSCDKSIFPVKGNGDVTTETRAFSNFNAVSNEGQFDVYLIQDDETGVKIEAESNLIGRIRTRMNGSTLEIDSKDNLKPSRPMKLFIHTPHVNGISLSGSGIIDLGTIITDDLAVSLSGSGEIYGDVEATDIGLNISGSGTADLAVHCDLIETFVSGSGDLFFSGSGHTARFNISGSGSVKAYNFPVADCYTKISGSGDMYVNVENYLEVNISGSGSVHYIGYPDINTNITGSGELISNN
jgi:hypothetical protein